MFDAKSTYSVDLNNENLLYIACQDDKDQVYVITGREFNALGVKNNTYIQLPMETLPQPIANPKDLTKRLNIKNEFRNNTYRHLRLLLYASNSGLYYL